MFLSNRLIASVALCLFAIVLAIVIGQQLAQQAMAVLLGVLAGVLVSIPTSLVVVWVTLRVMRQQPDSYPYSAPPAAPTYAPALPAQPQMPPGYLPVYWQTNTAVQPNWGQPAQPGAPTWQTVPPVMSPTQRQFQVIGGSSIEE